MIDIMGNSYGSGMMGGMWFFPLIFWILIIVGMVFIVRLLTERKRENTSSPESALTVLKKRYASGKIDRDTFEQIKHDIEDE